MSTQETTPDLADRPPPKEALVIYKKSKFDLYVNERKNERYLELLENKDASVAHLQDAHEVNKGTLEGVKAALKARGISFKTRYRARVTKKDCRDRLIITVGGDGTLLDASSRITNAWTLGVNSDPSRSVGFLCAANGETFAHTLDRVLDGDLRPSPVTRLRVEIDGHAKSPVLNDVLVTHKNPAATTQLVLKHDGHAEKFKSSGVWISGPAGSTAAMASAGGFIQDLDDPRIQVKVREPFWADGPRPRLLSFFIEPGEALEVESRIRAGAVYLDGPHKRHQFPIGAHLTVSADAPPLWLIANGHMRERRDRMRADRGVD
jgi:NAD+ kinase